MGRPNTLGVQGHYVEKEYHLCAKKVTGLINTESFAREREHQDGLILMGSTYVGPNRYKVRPRPSYAQIF